MKWSVYKQLTSAEKEEFNFKFKPPMRALFGEFISILYFCFFAFLFFFVLAIAVFVIVKFGENPDVISPDQLSILLSSFNQISWLAKISLQLLISGVIIDVVRLLWRCWKEHKFLQNTKHKIAERKKEEKQLRQKISKKKHKNLSDWSD